MKNFLKSALLFIFLLSPSLSSQQLIDGIAAIVGDNVILLSEVNGLVTQYAFQNKIDISQQPEIYRQLGKKFLQNLIDQKLLLIKADEDTIKSDEEKVDQSLKQQLDYLIQQAGSTEKLEEYYSEPLFKIKKDLRKEISNQMRIGMLRERKFGLIKISRREVSTTRPAGRTYSRSPYFNPVATNQTGRRTGCPEAEKHSSENSVRRFHLRGNGAEIFCRPERAKRQGAFRNVRGRWFPNQGICPRGKFAEGGRNQRAV